MSAADWWRVGYAGEFANNIERIAASTHLIARELRLLREQDQWRKDVIAAAEAIEEQWDSSELAGAVQNLLSLIPESSEGR